MIKRNVFFDFGLPVSADIIQLEKSPVFFYQNHLMIILVMSGNLKIKRQGKSKKYKEGDLILIDCNVPFIICPDKASILSLNINTSHYREQFPYIQHTILSEEIDSSTSDKLQIYLIGAALTLMENNKDSYTLLNDNIKNILSLTINDCQYFSSIIKKKYSNHHTRLEYNSLMQDIVFYIHEHYFENISLRSFSQSKHLSQNYLSHLIKKISGTTFKELLSNIRCRKSEIYLLDSSKKISEISYLVGFSTSSYYKSNFVKFYGMTPEEYRKYCFGLNACNHFPAECDQACSETMIRSFASRNKISLSLSSQRFFTVDTISINHVLERFRKVLSDEGEIRNIDSEMNTNSNQAFINMQKDFRMSTITIDASILVEQSINISLTIAKNINYLINSGFKITFIIHSLSPKLMSAVIKFMLFYSRRFIDTLEEIRFLINAPALECDLLKYKHLFFEKLHATVGPSFKIDIRTKTPVSIKYFSSIYDSFILPPFAMDELFNPENWNVMIDFSLIDSVDLTGNIMANGNGLLTWNGIKKPWWHAYHLSSKLRGNIISKGSDHIITNNNDLITILTYNTCGLPHSFLHSIKTNEQLFDIIQNKKHIREHCFQLSDVFGSYKIITYCVDETSCLFSKWAKLGYPQYLTTEEENLFSQICHPHVTFDTIQADGKISITTKETSFGVTCVVLEKV